MTEISQLLKETENMTLLKVDPNSKTSIFLGKKSDGEMILILRPKPLQSLEFMQSGENEEITFRNERFSKWEVDLVTKYEVSAIYPALDNELYKFRDRAYSLRIYQETAEDYQRDVLPYIREDDLGWIRDIFSGKTAIDGQKGEHIIHQDEYFVLLPDLKWDRKDLQSTYCLAIIRDSSLRSIRDLRAVHIDMLTDIQNRSLEIMSDKYQTDPTRIRSYFHYHPTYWWLHIHFNVIDYQSSGSSVDAAIPLTTVINNLRIADDYYQRATIPVVRAPFSHER